MLEQADYELTQLAYGQSTDKNLAVKFHPQAVPNATLTEKEGRLVCDTKDFVRIANPGDTTLVLDVEATEEHKRRFPRQWLAYKQGKEQSTASGSPIEALTGAGILTVGQVEELKHLNVFTVEQLSELRYDVADRIMGGHELKRKAQGFLDVAKDRAPAMQLQTALAAKDQELEQLKALVREQGERIEQLAAKSKKAKAEV